MKAYRELTKTKLQLATLLTDTGDLPTTGTRIIDVKRSLNLPRIYNREG
ncbi:hypothetical protein XBJ2_1000024 [Xenorhabdus bovienii str. Jollieti]|uniref:Uncharacterized protein n=1 Tax=Xenorhabdus bovienii (strain SS-2004) TaxID=406818 RepID=D3V2U6_XENBS|nr:hypothetical protein [Xenorhabdus bovienii]CBJ81061.1 hypothetical protein XBJ1_1935 [Xenorhabdus bovienii SS-2004]CDH26921.1 hypothetical protein XBJ2_1000024 [Xenorhabdus bovienii str. Jollieti]